MRKIISPFIYIAFLIPAFLGFIAVISFVENSVGFLFDLNGLVELPLFVITIGSILFIIANVVIARFEKLSKPTVLDHLRQSVGFYILGLAIVVKLAPQGFNTAALRDALRFAILIISLWAIVINAMYIIHRRWYLR